MSSQTDYSLSDGEAKKSLAKRRATYDASITIGIIVIALFLGLFVLEFTRILKMTEQASHSVPVKLESSASGEHRS